MWGTLWFVEEACLVFARRAVGIVLQWVRGRSQCRAQLALPGALHVCGALFDLFLPLSTPRERRAEG